MNCCEACFQEHANPLKSFTKATATMASCEFCGAAATDVWDAKDLLDSFTGIIGHYETAEVANPQSGPLAQKIQDDWGIFAFDEPDVIRQFLAAVFDGSPDDPIASLVANDSIVRLARKQGDYTSDPVDAWDRFSKELMYGNRFFPSVANSHDFLVEMVHLRLKRVEPRVKMFRARVCQSLTGHVAKEMGMPPSRFATAGRASPLGIPHLYLALEIETCIQESRAVQHNLVTVAQFEVKESLEVLNLRDVVRIDPFAIETDAAAQLDAAKTIERLGYELQRPVRPTDHEVEYIPTQYLSGLVKSLKIDGILYASSLRKGGTNLVLFSDSKVRISAETETYEITSASLGTRKVEREA
jgi:hypothetical protein